MNERNITMLSIRYLGQIAERLMHNLQYGVENFGNASSTAERCADYIEHIAQYDLEGLPEKSRMASAARALEWLSGIRVHFDGEFSVHGPQTPSLGEIDALRMYAQKARDNA